MTGTARSTPTASVDLTMRPFEAVSAQLGRQRLATDFHDATALEGIYAADCLLVLNTAGLDAATEIARVQGRAEIIAFMVADWAEHADGWYPGSMIHHVGTQVIEPAAGDQIRSRSYATFVHRSQTGAVELQGYGLYDDLWRLEEGAWRLASRSVVIYR